MLSALIGQTSACVARRLGLYAVLAVLAIALQAGIITLWRAPAAVYAAQLVVQPVFQAIVYAFTAADCSGEELPEHWPWNRVLERLWAVIVIDFLLFFINTQAWALTNDLVGYVLSGISIIAGASLMLADVSAVIEPDDNVALLIPRSFRRSLMAVWQPRIVWIAIGLYFVGNIVVQILVFFPMELLLTHYHVANALFWGVVPLGTLLIPPFSALGTLLYLHARQP